MYTGTITTRVEARLAAFTAVYEKKNEGASIETLIEEARQVENYLTEGMTLPDYEQPFNSKESMLELAQIFASANIKADDTAKENNDEV